MLNHATHAILRHLPTRDVGPVNPSFPISRREAIARLSAMQPKPLARPLLVLGGFLDLGVGPFGFARRMRRLVDGRVVPMTFAHCLSFDQCRRRVTRLAESYGEVDVVGQSMGGLIALLSALENGGPRLPIARLFTVASPLRGATLATLTPINLWPLQRHMRPGAQTYASLAAAPASFPVVSYARLGDHTVGTANASLPGEPLHWVDNPLPEPAHVGSLADVRILLDIALRLRGETPVTIDPATPLPV